MAVEKIVSFPSDLEEQKSLIGTHVKSPISLLKLHRHGDSPLHKRVCTCCGKPIGENDWLVRIGDNYGHSHYIPDFSKIYNSESDGGMGPWMAQQAIPYNWYPACFHNTPKCFDKVFKPAQTLNMHHMSKGLESDLYECMLSVIEKLINDRICRKQDNGNKPETVRLTAKYIMYAFETYDNEITWDGILGVLSTLVWRAQAIGFNITEQALSQGMVKLIKDGAVRYNKDTGIFTRVPGYNFDFKS